ncbi:MFS transporter [Nonlabens sp.]|uniref:MFS transporter n=1 Tax=Nonlabens sp. TaxID=1888209 RepID=UPI0032679110
MNNISKLGIFTILLVSSLTIMVGTAIAPSLSGIIKNTDFSFSPSWLITLPSLGVVVFAPFIGGILKKSGKFNLLIMGLIPYAVLGVLGAFIKNDYLLIIDRFLLGGATVMVQVSVTAFIAELFTGETRLKMVSWQVMSIELGGVVFLALGGVLGEINWQFPFYIYLLGLVCFLLVIKFLPKSKTVIETEVSDELTKIQNKLEVNVILMATLLAMMLFFIGFVTIPLYLPKFFNFDQSETGYLMAFISFIAIITASQMPKMVRALGDGKTVALGFIFFMLGYFTLSVALSTPVLIIAALLVGIGFGFTIPLLSNMIIDASDKSNQGKNLSLLSMAIFGGQFLSTFIEYISDDYKSIYGITAALAFIIALVLFYLFQKITKNRI